MIYRYLLTCVLLFLLGCASSSVDYTDEYSRTSDSNRAVQATQEAMSTDDVVDRLATMLGTKDQADVVVASNVQFIRNLNELNNPAYRKYKLRIADNIDMKRDMKDRYSRDMKDGDMRDMKDRYSKDSYGGLRGKLEELKEQYPRAVIAINKQDKIIAVALDSLEAQALAQFNRRVYYVLQGQTLKQTLTRWAKQAKWGMTWVVPKDYTMVAAATIFGEFNAQGGSLDQLLSTFQFLDQPLRAQFARNNMVVIRDGSYNSSIMAVTP